MVNTIAMLSTVFAALGMSEHWPAGSDKVACGHNAIAPQWYDTIVHRYLDVWGSEKMDDALFNSTFNDDFNLYQDKIVTGKGPIDANIHNLTGLREFMAQSRQGFSQYRFQDLYYFGQDNMVVLRWTLDAVFKGPAPGTTVKAGTPIHYNGTDVFTLNRCNGKIQEVDTAQDFITYYAALGFKSLPLS